MTCWQVLYLWLHLFLRQEKTKTENRGRKKWGKTLCYVYLLRFLYDCIYMLSILPNPKIVSHRIKAFHTADQCQLKFLVRICQFLWSNEFSPQSWISQSIREAIFSPRGSIVITLPIKVRINFINQRVILSECYLLNSRMILY